MFDYLLAPVMETDNDGFAVAFRRKAKALFLELFTEFDVVVNLTVKRQGVPLRVVLRPPAKRLVRMLNVNDGEAVETENRVRVVPCAGGVRASVVHAGKRPLNRLNKGGACAVGREHC